MPHLTDLMAHRIVEPFVGSGAFFLGAAAERALLADTNVHVTQSLQAVRDDPQLVLKYLSTLQNTKDVYLQVRAFQPQDQYTAAARLIYLTNTSWGGLYRENRRGQFNVPFGGNGRPFYSASLLSEAAAKLENAEIANGTYDQTLAKVRSNDLLFVDAPYVTKRSSEFFDRYHASRFTWSDQEKLAQLLQERATQGFPIIVTSAADLDVYALFKEWEIFEFGKRNSMVAKDKLGYRTEALLLSPALKAIADSIGDASIGKRLVR